MILVILFIATITCTKDEPPEKKEKWKEEVEQSNKDIKKEYTIEDEKGSKQSEDIEDLDEQNKSILITLKGYVFTGKDMLPITITIDKETNIVEGEAVLEWREENEVFEEGGESHHSHSYGCLVKLDKGTILGKIDENGNIIATISGFAYSDLGYNLETKEITDEFSSLCKGKITNRPESFTLKGRYFKDTNSADGQILPNGWEWNAK